jgi:serine/threonine protein kinase
MNHESHPRAEEDSLPILSSTGESEIAASSEMLAPSAPPTWPDRVGNFELVQILGVGGMGRVFLAKESAKPGMDSPSETRLVAVKILKSELAASSIVLGHFHKEIEFQKQLEHPHILRVLSSGTPGGVPFLAMPYMQQGSLARRIQNSGPLPREACLQIARQMVSALRFAHKRGIIHRDLKPANILLDQHGNAFIADFGLALTVFNDPLLQLGRFQPQGTASYWSPAVARGDAEDTRCDIYSFGAVLYETLTGRPPYEGKTSEEIVAKIVSGPPPPITELNPNAAPGLARIAEGAMSRELRTRYTDAEDLATDLERVARNEPPIGPVGQSRSKTRLGTYLFLFAVLTVIVTAALILARNIWKTEPVSKDSIPHGTDAQTDPGTNAPGLRLVRTFRLPGIWRYDAAKIGDYDGDGLGDLFMVHGGQLLVVSGEGQVLRQTAFASSPVEDLVLDTLWDIDLDQRDELVVRWREQTNVFAAILNQQFFELKRFWTTGSYRELRSGGDRRYSSLMRPETLVEVEGKAPHKVVAALTTGYELQPRAVVCFDFQSQNELWRQEIAPTPQEIIAIDLTDDEGKEIAFGTGAVGNGHKLIDGTDDRHCYVGLLSSAGKLLWRREVGGHYCYSTPIAAELNGEPGKEFVVLVNATHRYQDIAPHPELGQIIHFSSKGEVKGKYDAGHFLSKVRAADLDGDKRDEVLATDSLGFLHVLNPDLTLRKKVQISRNSKNYVELSVTAVCDLDLDGRYEIVLNTSDIKVQSEQNTGRDDLPSNSYINNDTAVVVLNAELIEISRFQVAAQSRRGFELGVGPPKGLTNAVELFVLEDEVKVLQWSR